MPGREQTTHEALIRTIMKATLVSVLQRFLKHTDTLGKRFFGFDATLSIARNRRGRWRAMGPAVTTFARECFQSKILILYEHENQKEVVVRYVTATIPLGDGTRHRTVAYEIVFDRCHGEKIWLRRMRLVQQESRAQKRRKCSSSFSSSSASTSTLMTSPSSSSTSSSSSSSTFDTSVPALVDSSADFWGGLHTSNEVLFDVYRVDAQDLKVDHTTVNAFALYTNSEHTNYQRMRRTRDFQDNVYDFYEEYLTETKRWNKVVKEKKQRKQWRGRQQKHRSQRGHDLYAKAMEDQTSLRNELRHSIVGNVLANPEETAGAKAEVLSTALYVVLLESHGPAVAEEFKVWMHTRLVQEIPPLTHEERDTEEKMLTHFIRYRATLGERTTDDIRKAINTVVSKVSPINTTLAASAHRAQKWAASNFRAPLEHNPLLGERTEESIDDMYLVSDQQCNSRLVRSDKHGTGILLNRPYYDEHSDMVAAMRRASDILLNILDYIDAGRLRADIFDPDSQTVTLKSLNNSGRIIQGVTALGEDGAKPLAASMQVTSIFHSSLALMALLSFPSHYDFSAGCDHPDHPVVGSCSGCDMKLHYFNFDANSEYEKYLVGLSFNLSEDDLARRAEFMMPIISERVELEKNGLMYGDIHIRFQHEDTAQDMKRYVSNRNYRFGVGLHANSCYLCGADSAHFESDLGTFEMPDADEYTRRLQVGKEIIRRGGSAHLAGLHSQGLDVQPFTGGEEASGINRRFDATHFDPLHMCIALALYVLNCFALEQVREFPDEFQKYHQRQDGWTAENKKNFKKDWIKLTKDKFKKFGVHIMLLMLTGGVLRKICDPAVREELLMEFVPVKARRGLVRGALEKISLAVKILRSKRPAAIYPIHQLKDDIFVPLGKYLLHVWPQFKFRPYMHMFFEHSQKVIQRYNGIGPWSAEGSEALNKFLRLARQRQARGTLEEATVDAMYSLMMRNDYTIRPWMVSNFD